MDEPTNVVKTRANLLIDLQMASVSMSILKGERVFDMQDPATLKNVATAKRVRK